MIELNMTFFAQIINFVILVVLLRAVAYKPVVNMLKAREDRIKESLDKADADAAEADKLLADYKKKLAAANVKAEDIIRNAEKRASEEREAARAETKREIEQMKKAAEAEIQRDRERAVAQLRGEVVALSMAAAGKIISKNIDKAENEQLITEFVDKLDKDKIGDLPC
ncbi:MULTISPECIES: F0F1 ATP synthase subunit B [Selenomonas]|uniref:ATP synthase subunit b n=1 Tax=Selenomonas ruminis TaxID=2593411 RepID=A0A5D6WBM5_9FIRM|nr:MULTISPECIES: F0F1 ATP synthase subunit B [unclassified Selenomonas]MBQ1867248.1 F0F1 ATP synthase subunit B [Selenomonas sp.]MDD6133166.1 F0F1 ATP synthase subunit B [Selenomonadaceae bacterium]TYZ23984.1 F0F1 ATP synthase subunit B [Selenomonas sp. mPRGC5]